MSSHPMNALASFVYLTEHLPIWTTKVNTLTSRVITKREEFGAEYKRVLKQARPKKEKTPSVTSLQPNDDQASINSQDNNTNAGGPAVIACPRDISPLDPAARYLFANARRGKRRQANSLHSGASGPQTFRNNRQVIIYYDSIIQNDLEGLVKDLATARNNLRKGKQAMTLERGLRLPPLQTGDYTRRQQYPILPSGPKLRPPAYMALGTKIALNDPQSNDDASFTEVSKGLEAAQALCENAAHQFLRDGDCTVELRRIRAYFEDVEKVAEAQLQTWRLEKSDSGHGNENTETASKDEDLDMGAATKDKIGVNSSPCVTTQHVEIEIDSDDGDDEHDMAVDMSQFRAARMTGLRA